MNQKTLLLLAIFTTVLTMGAGCTTNQETTNDNSILPYNGAVEPSDQAVVPTNWKTYTNKDYGYSIQYPSTWTVDLTTKDSRGKTLATFLAPGQKNVPHDKTIDIQVSPMTDVSRVDSADYIKRNGNVIISTSPVVVGGITTDKFITDLNNGYNMAVYVEKNSETYVLGLHNTTSSDKEYIDNFNLMLSSFKFTK
ncbi:MAG: PsbP-related protein [Patescibacteria group bacterium]|nr:PsbP-related protein [Patescibacteria group bacterium]